MPNYSIGVDLGGTNLRIAAVDEQGRLLEKITLGTQVALGRERVITDMCDAIRQLSARYNNAGALQGIGIGVPGIIDMKTGMVRESPNLPGWTESPVRAEIEKRLGTRVILENDANVAALGEKWLGAGRDVEDLAILTLGTGVGGGLILGGRVWHGMTGMAGEFGHITIEPEGVRCGCGNRGCLEQYASASAVVRRQLRAERYPNYRALKTLTPSSARRRFTTLPFKATMKRRKSSGKWDAPWASRSPISSTP
jgi:glucokinase